MKIDNGITDHSVSTIIYNTKYLTKLIYLNLNSI